MSETQTDAVHEIRDAFERAFPGAQVIVRRHDWEVRIKITDPSFKGQDRIRREERAFPVVEQLRPEVAGDITMLLLRAPGDKPLLSDVLFDEPQAPEI
jgi:hypothetical protein